jgi:hypothetical protein
VPSAACETAGMAAAAAMAAARTPERVNFMVIPIDE